MVGHYYNAKRYDARRSIGYLVRHSSAIITCKIEALFAEKDLTFIQYVILMNLRDELAVTCADLCGVMRYDSGAITRVIDQLEKRKLLKRQRSTTDRRVVKLAITPHGKKVVESLIPVVVQQYNEWFTDFSKEETDTLIMLLTKFNTKISDKKPEK